MTPRMTRGRLSLLYTHNYVSSFSLWARKGRHRTVSKSPSSFANVGQRAMILADSINSTDWESSSKRGSGLDRKTPSLDLDFVRGADADTRRQKAPPLVHGGVHGVWLSKTVDFATRRQSCKGSHHHHLHYHVVSHRPQSHRASPAIDLRQPACADDEI